MSILCISMVILSFPWLAFQIPSRFHIWILSVHRLFLQTRYVSTLSSNVIWLLVPGTYIHSGKGNHFSTHESFLSSTSFWLISLKCSGRVLHIGLGKGWGNYRISCYPNFAYFCYTWPDNVFVAKSSILIQCTYSVCWGLDSNKRYIIHITFINFMEKAKIRAF